MSRRKAGRRPKPGPRTKSGHLSRAISARDQGTHEAQAKRRALVGPNSNLALAESAPGILHAHGYLDRDQFAKALKYRALRCALYGPPWPTTTNGSEPTDKALRKLKLKFNALVRTLTPEQKHVVTNVAVFDRIPMWFFAYRLGLKILPEDVIEQSTLVSALDAMLGRCPAARSSVTIDNLPPYVVAHEMRKSELCL